MTSRSFFQKKANILFFVASIVLILLPLIRIAIVETRIPYLIDFCSYCHISFALFKGYNPFPDHPGLPGFPPWEDMPIVYPGHMLLFAPLGFLWSKALQIAWVVFNILIVIYLTCLTLVKACGFKWHDLLMPGRKQFIGALCCFIFLSSNNVMDTMRLGQIPVVLALCLYWMFWGPPSRILRTFLFAFLAVTKYSLLTVFAPLLFFKGYWKLCICAFVLFIFFSISPVFCGNDLKEVYVGYYEAVKFLFSPGHVNHYGTSGATMCHLGFFKVPMLNHILKAITISGCLYLFWKESKTRVFSDTLLLLALCLTMLISYHQNWDLSLIFPLFFIRLFAFARTKEWWHFGITACFMLFLIVPGTLCLKIFSIPGGIPGLGSVFYLVDKQWSMPVYHVFPFMAFYMIALTFWSLYLYLHVKNPYCFEIPGQEKKVSSEKPVDQPETVPV